MEDLDITRVTVILSFVLALSVASERLVEIFKGLIGIGNSAINTNRDTDNAEAGRQAVIHFLALICGLITSFLVWWLIPDNGVISSAPGAVAYGVLASGGSGLWNTILTYFLSIKNIKEEQEKKLRAAVNNELLLNDALVKKIKDGVTAELTTKFETKFRNK